ncbi:uncharacterized protein [Palaemon carinicauda]|uniref:uncharacterized protein n=1 Tax=Palaemon carinicauda TaxID=392227 RepID=UPI0035B59730
MVYSRIPHTTSGRTSSPCIGDQGHYKRVLGYSRCPDKTKVKKDLDGDALRTAMRKTFRPKKKQTLITSKVKADGWDPNSKIRNPKLQLKSPRLRRSEPIAFKNHNPGGKNLPLTFFGMERTAPVQSGNAVPKAEHSCTALNPGRDSPKVSFGSLRVGPGRDSPRAAGRVHKPTWRPKKSVHWKTNIATWIQMTAMNSSVSVSEDSSGDDEWNGKDSNTVEKENETSDDDGTMRFNTAGKSTFEGSSTKEDDSSDFEYTDFGKVEGKISAETKTYVNPYFDSLSKGPPSSIAPPIPPPPPLPNIENLLAEDTESHYYSELSCSCGCQGSIYSGNHTYEDVGSSIINGSLTSQESKRHRHISGSSNQSSDSNHTYCEISHVGRGAKPEVLGTLFRNNHHLNALKSTLVHVLPKEDIISTTLLACRLGDLEYLQDLTKQKRMDGHAHDLQGATCLHYAARGGHMHILRFLIEDMGVQDIMRCEVGATPLHDAAALGHLHVIKYLNKHSKHTFALTDHDGSSVLHVAARYGRLNVLRWLLLDAGMPGVDRTQGGALALHYAAARGCLECVKLLVETSPDFRYGRLNVLRWLLLDAGMPGVDRTQGGALALHYAAARGCLECVKLLVETSPDFSRKKNVPVYSYIDVYFKQ